MQEFWLQARAFNIECHYKQMHWTMSAWILTTSMHIWHRAPIQVDSHMQLPTSAWILTTSTCIRHRERLRACALNIKHNYERTHSTFIASTRMRTWHQLQLQAQIQMHAQATTITTTGVRTQHQKQLRTHTLDIKCNYEHKYRCTHSTLRTTTSTTTSMRTQHQEQQLSACTQL